MRYLLHRLLRHMEVPTWRGFYCPSCNTTYKKAK